MALAVLFFSALMIGFSGAIMPGPLLTVSIHESLKRGFFAGPLLVIGHGILEIILVLALISGLDTLIVNPVFKAVISFSGGMVLLWMAWQMVRDSRRGQISLEFSASGPQRGMPPVLAGIVVSLSNPYWVLWWATVGLAYITEAMRQGPLAVAVFLAGHLLADLSWYSGVSFAVSSGRKILNDQIYRAVVMVCGVFLGVLAVYFIISGLNFYVS